MSQARNTQSVASVVNATDIRTAVDILGFPRHFRVHFQTLPRRLYPFGVRCTGSKTNYYKDYGMKSGEKVESLDAVEAVLNSIPKSARARVDTRKQWPEEWDRRHGFKWRTEIEESIQNEDSESEIELPPGFVKMEIQNLEGREISPSLFRPSEDREQEENILLDAETAYLDALDAQCGQIELEWLNRYMKEGELRARRWREDARETFTLNEDVRAAKRHWGKVQKRFTRKFGGDWGAYPWDGVGVEGIGWERPPEDWQLFQKQNPVTVDVAMPERKLIETDPPPSKRVKAQSDENSEQNSNIDYSDLDLSEYEE
jgi:hypothetical protein